MAMLGGFIGAMISNGIGKFYISWVYQRENERSRQALLDLGNTLGGGKVYAFGNGVTSTKPGAGN